MHTLISLELAEVRQGELRADAEAARLAAEVRGARRQSRLDWLRRLGSRGPRDARTPSARPASVTWIAAERASRRPGSAPHGAGRPDAA
jgi:hypothetical protein